jgi:hypothetical protein
MANWGKDAGRKRVIFGRAMSRMKFVNENERANSGSKQGRPAAKAIIANCGKL